MNAMKLSDAIGVMMAIVSAATENYTRLMAVSAVINKAYAEGRTTLTDEEMAAFKNADAAARIQLTETINQVE